MENSADSAATYIQRDGLLFIWRMLAGGMGLLF